MQHRETTFACLTQEALVDQRPDGVQVPAERRGSIEVEPSCQDPEPAEDPLLDRVQQLVAPVDRRAQCALSLGEVTRTASDRVQAAAEPVQDLRRGQHLYPCGGKFNGKREAVQATDEVE